MMTTKTSEKLSKKGMLLIYIICINGYAFTKYILQIVVNQIPDISTQWVYVVNIIALFLIFFCGCLAGLLVEKNTIFHASSATILSVVFSVFLMSYKLSDYMVLGSLFALGAMMGGLGGAAALVIKKLLKINRISI